MDGTYPMVCQEIGTGTQHVDGRKPATPESVEVEGKHRIQVFRRPHSIGTRIHPSKQGAGIALPQVKFLQGDLLHDT